jgi:hypothetical protein
MPAKEQVRQSLAGLPGRILSERVASVRDQWLPERARPETLVRNYDVTDSLVPLLDVEKEPSAIDDIGSMKKVLRDGDLAISRLRISQGNCSCTHWRRHSISWIIRIHRLAA